MKKTIYLLAIATLMLVACSETDYSDKGKIMLTTDWTKRTDGVAIPRTYTAKVGDQSAELRGITNEYPHLILAGTHTVYVYNTADKISVGGTTATVSTVSAGIVEFMPDWFFSGKASVTIVSDGSHDVTVAMKQEVCQLDITLTVTEGNPAMISSVAGTLKGVAGAWDFNTDAPAGDAVSVIPNFTQANDKITASMRLLGIMPSAAQELTLVVTFSDSSTQTITKDLTDLLADFNIGKHIPVGITADMQTRTDAGFTCTINDWQTTAKRPGTAN